MSDLVERLRNFDTAMAMYKIGNAEMICSAAADHIEAQDKRIAELEEIEQAAREVYSEIGELSFEDWPELHLKNNRLGKALKDALATQENSENGR